MFWHERIPWFQYLKTLQCARQGSVSCSYSSHVSRCSRHNSRLRFSSNCFNVFDMTSLAGIQDLVNLRLIYYWYLRYPAWSQIYLRQQQIPNSWEFLLWIPCGRLEVTGERGVAGVVWHISRWHLSGLTIIQIITKHILILHHIGHQFDFYKTVIAADTWHWYDYQKYFDSQFGVSSVVSLSGAGAFYYSLQRVSLCPSGHIQTPDWNCPFISYNHRDDTTQLIVE